MNSQAAQQSPLGTQPIGKLLLKYAIPSVVSMLVNSLYNIVDQIFIAQGVGFLGNGATTVAFPLVTVSLALTLLVGNGAAAFISLELGRGNTDKANRTLGNAILLLLCAGLGLMAVILLFMQPLLRLMGATDQIMPYAVDYMTYIAMGFPFVMLGIGMSNIIRADGSPRYSMFCTLVGAALNVVLDPIFIFTFDMGVKGAAIATALSQVVSFAIAAFYILRMGNYVRFSLPDLRPSGEIVRKVAGLGSSSFATQMSIVVVNVVLNNVLRHYGPQSVYGADIAIAGIGIVMKISSIFISIILGIAIGAQPILGYNYGAKNYERVKKTYRTEVTAAFCFSLLANILFVTVPELLIRIFWDENPMFNEFAIRALSTYLCCVFAAGIQIPSANFFQAIGKPLKAMTLSMTRQLLLLIPCIVIMPALMGFEGVLYAMPVTDLAALCITLPFIIRELRGLGNPPALQADPASPER